MKFIFAVFVLVFACSAGFAQPINIFPPTNSAGIGTQLSVPAGPINALQIHYDLNHLTLSQPAILRMSEGYNPLTINFGTLGLAHLTDSIYSTLVDSGIDLVLHHNYGGDMIFTNWAGVERPYGGAIRFATTGDTTKRPAIDILHHDLERMTILGNGNVGINLPPDANGLGKPMDQLQIGGGRVASGGYLDPWPGLTFSGGNRFEGQLHPAPDTGIYPVDYRALTFNGYEDHDSGKSYRFARMSSSGLRFAPISGGLLTLQCWPYDSNRGKNDFRRGVTFALSGNEGIEFTSDESDSDQFHHLFDCWRPGWHSDNALRNVNGLFAHRTPVYIRVGGDVPNFTNLPYVHPNLGDDSTWMLAVNGSILAKEVFVSLDWPDYVFSPDYKLMPLSELAGYVLTHHHLPGIASADSMAKTGVPLGQVSAKIMEKVEEQALYIIELSKKVEALEAKVETLEKGAKQ